MHILDNASMDLVLSDSCMDLTPDTHDFLRMHVEKILKSDDARHHCVFDDSSALLPLVREANADNFVETSRTMAKMLFDIMKDSTIPAGDIFLLVFGCDGKDYMAMLKMNYKSSYTHSRSDNMISIVPARGMLPSSSSRLSEAFVVDLSNGEITVCERPYEINGTKTNYLTAEYLQCHTRKSEKAKLNTVAKAVEKVAKEHYGDQAPVERMEIKRVMCDALVQPEGLVIEELPKKLFPTSPSMQEDLSEKLAEANLEKEVIAAQNPVTTRKFKTQHLITDAGIEIKIPMEAYEDSDKVEVITNEDGSTSVLIKHIAKITAK